MTGRKTKPKGARAAKAAAKTPRRARSSGKKSEAAAPLLAHVPKKVGAAAKSSGGRNSQSRASYQPKTEPPATPVRAQPAAPDTTMNLMTMAQPWMTLGWRMTAAGLALQARMAKAALEMPPAATAMRQGAEAMSAWFKLMQTRPPKARKD